MRILSSDAFLDRVSSIVGEQVTSLQVPIDSLDVDSLQALELIMSLEDEDVRLDEDVFIDAHTLDDLYRSYITATTDRSVGR